MRNPWIKRNPFMSMWLSGANRMWGAARGQSMAASTVLYNAMAEEGVRNLWRFWGAVLPPPKISVAAQKRGAPRKRRKR